MSFPAPIAIEIFAREALLLAISTKRESFELDIMLPLFKL